MKPSETFVPNGIRHLLKSKPVVGLVICDGGPQPNTGVDPAIREKGQFNDNGHDRPEDGNRQYQPGQRRPVVGGCREVEREDLQGADCGRQPDRGHANLTDRLEPGGSRTRGRPPLTPALATKDSLTNQRMPTKSSVRKGSTRRPGRALTMSNRMLLTTTATR